MGEHDIEWLTPEGAPAKRRGKDSVESTVSHLEGVKLAVDGKAMGMAREASMELLSHRKTGGARVEMGRHPNPGAETPDWYVYLVDMDPGGEGKAGNRRDRSAMSIEFGWTQTHAFGKKLKRPVHHDGLHILGGVMKRAVRR